MLETDRSSRPIESVNATVTVHICCPHRIATEGIAARLDRQDRCSSTITDRLLARLVHDHDKQSRLRRGSGLQGKTGMMKSDE